MSIPDSSTASNSVLPVPPQGLTYRRERLKGEDYVTTGAFEPGGTRTLEDLRWAPVLVADFDMVDFLARENGWTGNTATKKAQMYRELSDPAALAAAKQRHQEEVVRCVRAGLGVFESCQTPYQLPTFYVDSGWGLHVYWLLAEPATGERIVEVRKLNETLVSRINAMVGYHAADPGVHDTGTRLLRPLGSFNQKASTLPQKVAVIPALSHPELRWGGEVVHQVEARDLPAGKTVGSKAPPTPEGEPQKPQPQPQQNSSASPTAHTAEARDSLGYVLQKDRNLDRAYAHALTEQTSEADWTFACAMAKCRMPPRYIASMLEHAIRVQAPHEHGGTDYFTRTAEKAWSTVQPGVEGDAEKNWMLPHPKVLWRLREGDSPGQVMHAAASADPRVRATLWTDERTSTVRWAEGAVGEANVFRWCAATGTPTPRRSGGSLAFTDENYRHWCAWLSRVYGTTAAQRWEAMPGWLAGGLPHRNPVREYLLACAEALPKDADETVLDTWLSKVFDVEDTPLTRVYARKWLIGGAARGFDPGVFIKSMLILVGGQSVGKTTALRILASEPWYVSPEVRDLGHKDVAMVANSAWLLEFEEMAALNVSSIESVKKFVTTCEDRIRLPYGATIQSFRRACFYAGSSNTTSLFVDPSGSTRFWTVEVRRQADFAWLRQNRDLLWGLAARAWLKVRCEAHPGSTKAEVLALDLTAEERAALEDANADYTNVDALHDTILGAAVRSYQSAAYGAPGVTWDRLVQELGIANVFNDMNAKTQARVRRVLEGAGWTFKRARDRSTGAVSSARVWCPPDELVAAKMAAWEATTA